MLKIKKNKSKLQLNLSETKRTKILASVGPASENKIPEMFDAGVNAFRLNFSHGDHNEHFARVRTIRKYSKIKSKPAAIILDLQGPKIRLGMFEGDYLLSEGESWTLGISQVASEANKSLPIQYDLSTKMKVGQRLYLVDGKIRSEVTAISKKAKTLTIKIMNNGMVSKKKGINVPDTSLAGDVITKKDLLDIEFGIKHDVDYIALSFVQSAEDIIKLKELIAKGKSNIRVIAKIETPMAITNIKEIIKVSDAIMVARGDLAYEIGPEFVPIVQRQIIDECIRQQKISIVATQMLLSMVSSPEPTRAEVSDVATAVLMKADCLMLSDESNSGKYPIEAIQMMKKIILATQGGYQFESVQILPEGENIIQNSIGSAVRQFALAANAKAIVAETRSGQTALSIASWRPRQPLIVVTNSQKTADQCSIIYGTKIFIRPVDKHAATKLTTWLVKQNIFETGDLVVTVSGKYPGRVGTIDTIKIREI